MSNLASLSHPPKKFRDAASVANTHNLEANLVMAIRHAHGVASWQFLDDLLPAVASRDRVSSERVDSRLSSFDLLWP